MTSTRGNAAAGALAASLAAIATARLLAGDRMGCAGGREVLVDAGHQQLFSTELRRNPRCRFDHERWAPRRLADLSLGEVFDLAAAGAADARLTVPERSFLTRIACPNCGGVEEPWRLHTEGEAPGCPACAQPRQTLGFHRVDALHRARVPAALLARPLSERGLRAGELFAVASAGRPTRRFLLEPMPAAAAEAGSGRVVQGGCGNIGSFLAPLLARQCRAELGVLVLCDPDSYLGAQIAGQDMRPCDSGHNKARVQAERVRALRPELVVEAVEAPFETLPLGAFAGAVALGALDSRAARMRLAARAWHMGAPFVDAAVGGGESLLARVDVYLPEADAACFECGFSDADYERLEQVVPCAGSAVDAPRPHAEGPLSGGSPSEGQVWTAS